ncbi:MAG: hypothetical protein KJN62_05710 [Deltaproteobacteria bacterium]|nr:hypothetical protein [Deltaproteobacteria bacterium]
MDKLDVLFQIKLATPPVETQLMNHDAIEVEKAKLKLKGLAERLHREYGDFMSSEQFEWAKDDIDYFSFLLEEAVAHYKKLLTQDKEF